MVDTKKNVKWLKFPEVQNPEGNLYFIQNYEQIPFEIKRVFYTSAMPAQAKRGGHAHKELEQVIIAAKGSFLIETKSRQGDMRFLANAPYLGLYIPAGVWVDISDYSEDSLCLVLCSDYFKEEDYLRNYEGFLIYQQNEII
jgi:dTDP-4-dehydrorhamnose 3,5-epimerase-like enzyme